MNEKKLKQKSKTAKVNESVNNSTQLLPGISLEKRYELIREQIKHEDELINQRLNWLLLSQGFLFASLTAMVTADKTKLNIDPSSLQLLITGIPVAGLIFNIFSFSGLDAAYRSLKSLRENWLMYKPASLHEQNYFNSFPQITWRKPALTTASGTPMIISLVWLGVSIAVSHIIWLNWTIAAFAAYSLFSMIRSTRQNQK